MLWIGLRQHDEHADAPPLRSPRNGSSPIATSSAWWIASERSATLKGEPVDLQGAIRGPEDAGLQTEQLADFNQRVILDVEGGCLGDEIGRHLLLRTDLDACMFEVPTTVLRWHSNFRDNSSIDAPDLPETSLAIKACLGHGRQPRVAFLAPR